MAALDEAAPRVRGFEVRLWPEQRAMLRDFADMGVYPTAYSETMRYLQSHGIVERLEECGQNGTAVLTEEGQRLIAALTRPHNGESR